MPFIFSFTFSTLDSNPINGSIRIKEKIFKYVLYLQRLVNDGYHILNNIKPLSNFQLGTGIYDLFTLI